MSVRTLFDLGGRIALVTAKSAIEEYSRRQVQRVVSATLVYAIDARAHPHLRSGQTAPTALCSLHDTPHPLFHACPFVER